MEAEPMSRLTGENAPTDRPLRLAVLSGKGGTGKTFVAVGLAVTSAHGAEIAGQYMDCDVEEPNGHLFLKPTDTHTEPVRVMVPAYHADLCDGCRICTSFCRFNALAFIRDRVKLFPELCHGCNGCVLLCPKSAMTESSRPIGTVSAGRSYGVSVLTGTLNPGEATGVSVIASLMRASRARPASCTVMDSPPGSGCAVMECIREADACVLVAEPTPFGLHDVGMVAELVRKLGKPAGLLFNRCSPESAEVVEEAGRHLRLPVLEAFSFDPEVARTLAEGDIPARVNPLWRKRFEQLWESLAREVLP
jgi:MinD superfamily P-loop ATPase